MGLTFLMSYPGSDWQIRGGTNPFSAKKTPTNPRAALKEWLALGDAITHAGGRIIVMPPEAGATGLPYTSNLGSLFRQTQGASFLIGQSSTKHRAGDGDRAAKFLQEAGVPVVRSKHNWQGQSEAFLLKGSRVILTYGARSSREAFEEVRPMLVPGGRIMDLELSETSPFGDMTIGVLYTRAGDCVLLASSTGLGNRTIPELRSFVGDYAEVLQIEEQDDAQKLVCQSLSVNGTLIVPADLSTGLRANLLRRGFTIEEIDLPELLGKGGGGPRALVNELYGLVMSEDGPTYTNLRERIGALVATYPETATAVVEKSDKPEKAEKPEKADKPDKPAKPKK